MLKTMKNIHIDLGYYVLNHEWCHSAYLDRFVRAQSSTDSMSYIKIRNESIEVELNVSLQSQIACEMSLRAKPPMEILKSWHVCSLRLQFVLSNYNSFPRITHFVPSIWTINPLSRIAILHPTIRGNELEHERMDCQIRGNELPIHGNELLICENGLHNSI